jgi:uncharacterized protein YbaA (DUF1428 family)
MGGIDFLENCSRGVSKWAPAARPRVTNRGETTLYVDGFLIPIPKKNIATYRKIAKLAGKVWKEYGALDYVECVADELESKHDGKVVKSIFPKMAGTKAGETIVFSWVTYKSKADRNRIMKKVMADPRLTKMMDPKKMPFDMERMGWGGFKPIVEA